LVADFVAIEQEGDRMLREGSLAHIRRHWAVFAGLAVALAIWCTVDVSRRAIVDPERPYLHMTDFSVYTEAGAAFFDGRAPYDVQNVRGWKYLYPPLFALLVAPLAHISSPWQAAVWLGVSVLLCLGSYFECRRLLAAILNDTPRYRKVAWQLGLVAGVTVLFPLMNCLQRGQIGVALLYPLLLGFRLALLGQSRSAWLAGGIVLALPVVLKLTPVLPVGCLVVACIVAHAAARRRAIEPEGRGSRRAGIASAATRNSGSEHMVQYDALAPLIRAPHGPYWLTAGTLSGGVLFALLMPAALVGWHANLGHLQTWYSRVVTKANHDRTDQFAENGSTFRNQSLSNAVHRFGNWIAYMSGHGPDDRLVDTSTPELGTMPMDYWLVDRVLLAIRGLAAVVLLAAVVALGKRAEGLSLGFVLGLACVATLVISPVARGHYFLLYLPAVLFGGAWMIERLSAKTALAVTVTPLLLCLAHYATLNYAGRIGLLGIGTGLWFFATCGIVLADSRRTAVTAMPVDLDELRARAAA
jgi:hypothetical protein